MLKQIIDPSTALFVITKSLFYRGKSDNNIEQSDQGFVPFINEGAEQKPPIMTTIELNQLL